MYIERDIDANINQFKDVFKDCADIVARKIPLGETHRHWLYVTYIDGLIQRSMIEDSILNNILVHVRGVRSQQDVHSNVFEAMRDGGFASADIKEVTTLEEASSAMMSGDCIFLLDGYEKAVVVSAKGWPNRGVGKTDTEMVIQGSKEAFTETMRMNTALIRRRIRDTNLKVVQKRCGVRSQTDIAIMYLKDVARKKVLDDLYKRLDKINIDAILDSGYIEQFLETDYFSPFPLVQVTERPDKAASAILEGRVVVVVDNSPFVILLPATLNTFFQSSEDYYERWQIMSFTRVLRFFCAMLAVVMPGLYIAIAVYHPDMVPTQLALKMAAARLNIPFPTVVEIIGMEIAFELLREAGLRLPTPIGSALGIVGGLIVGQAVVEAGFVSPVVVIVVAITAIASFTIPQASFTTALRLIKFFIIGLCALFGLFGFWLSVLVVLTHVTSLKSFGFPYLFPFTSGEINNYSDAKDTLFRTPLVFMRKRPIFADPLQQVRMSKQKEEE